MMGEQAFQPRELINNILAALCFQPCHVVIRKGLAEIESLRSDVARKRD